MKVFVWIGVRFSEEEIGDVYVFSDSLEQARETIKAEWPQVEYADFKERVFKDDPTTIFDNPMAWVDMYCGEKE